MPALGSLFPNSDVQKGSFLNTGGGTVGNYWALIDEAIASANDADYIRGPAGVAASGTSAYDAGLTNMPADFLSMTNLSYNVRYRQFTRTDDTLGFTMLIETAGGTALTNTVTFANVTTTAFTSSGATAFTLTTAGTNGTKSDWDGAVLVITQTYSASMANDNAYIAISAIELTGNYTSFSTVSRTATSSGTGSSSASGVIVKPRTATSSGTGSSSASGTITRPRTASSSGTGSSSSVILATRVRTGSASGTGSSSAAGVVTRFRTASASGTGSSTVIFAQTVDRTASSSGVGSSSATGVKGQIVGPTTSSGVGSSSVVILVSRLRTASSSGVGSSVIIAGRAIAREALASGQGSSPNVLWVNAGRTLNEGIKLPPFWIDAKPKFVRRR